MSGNLTQAALARAAVKKCGDLLDKKGKETVYNLINNIEDKYILKFQRDNEVIYTIAYSNICYPENAVVIMVDRIIRKLNRE